MMVHITDTRNQEAEAELKASQCLHSETLSQKKKPKNCVESFVCTGSGNIN